MDRLPKKNLTAKIVAVILAIILWVYVMNEQNPPVETFVEVPLEVNNLSSSYVAVDIPESVRVKVRGPRMVLIGLSKKDIQSSIDLKGLSEGRNTVKVHTTIPSNMEVVEVNPDKINLLLDAIVSRQVPVEVKITGKPANDAIVGKVTYNMSYVTVEGPRSLLDKANKVVTSVDVAGKSADFTSSGTFMVADASGKEVDGLSVLGNQGIATVAFVTGINKKLVDVKPNIVGVLAKGLLLKQINLNPLQVEISGDAKIIEKTDLIYTEPIDVTQISKDTNLDVKLQLKENINASQNTVKVNIIFDKQQ